MNSNKTKIQIDVKIGEEYITLTVPFSQQDDVRRIESELTLYLKELKAKVPNKGQKTYLAMAAYHFASYYFFLKDQYEKESDEAEDLLMEMSRLLGDDNSQDAHDGNLPSSLFDEY